MAATYDDDDDFALDEYDDYDDEQAYTSYTSRNYHIPDISAVVSSHTVHTSVKKMQQLETHKRTLSIDRNDRATSEQVLDPRTRLILFKLLSTGFLEKLDGCLSTGKEANVYYAKAGGQQGMATTTVRRPKEFAIKIYKTSILVAGEHRWRKGYCKSNPRKMVKTWAEKELRNYKRIFNAGIPTPEPILLKQHILIMEFLGTNGWCSPRLKDANLSESRLREAYVMCIKILRDMYQKCRLVHGDLSEYNLLWHEQQIYVIDVSQSVETDHPSALDFLRKDIYNVNDFFRKVGKLPVMTTRQLFEYVVTPLTDESTTELEVLCDIMKIVEERHAVETTADERREREQQLQVDEAVFMSSFLPRSLNQIADHEMRKLESGEVEETYAIAVASMTGNRDVVDAVEKRSGREGTLRVVPLEEDLALMEDDDSDDGEPVSSSDEEPQHYGRIPKTPEELEKEREERKAQRKANKKAVKEANSEKRKEKLKKKDKKRAIKKCKAGNKKR